jgi:Domain of unknown function (DUF5667)
VRDLSRPLQECLEAIDKKDNLQDMLRRYPADRDELIALLRLSVDLGGLAAPSADPAFRLQARNRMLAAAAVRRRAGRWNPLAALPRRVVRVAYAGALAVALVAGGITVAAASADSLPGDPLYGVKLTVEQTQLATTFDSASRARLQLQFADVRLAEAQRLFAVGRVQDAVRGIRQYDAAVTEFNRAIASTPLDTRAAEDLSRLMDDREARADASLNELAGSLAAGGDPEAAAAIARTQAHVDQAWRGSKRDLRARSGSGQPGAQKPKPSPGETPDH